MGFTGRLRGVSISTGADFISYVLMTKELAYGDAGICNRLTAANSFSSLI